MDISVACACCAERNGGFLGFQNGLVGGLLAVGESAIDRPSSRDICAVATGKFRPPSKAKISVGETVGVARGLWRISPRTVTIDP